VETILSNKAAVVKKPTIKDVALIAGVHFSAVSMALRGEACIPEATKQRIRKAADQLGYVRDPVLMALTQRRLQPVNTTEPQRIALLSNRSPEAGFFRRYPHYRLISKGVRHQAAQLGYKCELLFLDQGHYNSKTLYRRLKYLGIKGLVMAAFEVDRRSLDLPWNEFCVVKIDSRQLVPNFHFVSVDQLHYTRLAFQQMGALGYRRIGMAVGLEEEKSVDDLHTAALRLEQAAIPEAERVDPFYFLPGMDTPLARKAILPWIQKEHIDAVMSSWSQVRLLVRSDDERCRTKTACAAMCKATHARSLAGIVGDFHLVGRRATMLLASLLRSGQFGIPANPTSTYIQGVWQNGTSAPFLRNPS